MQNMIFPIISEYEMKLPYFIAGVGCCHDQEHVIRPNGYPYFQWIQCRKGKGRLLTEDSSYNVAENQGMLLYPDVPHEYYSAGGSWIVDWIIFGGCNTADFIHSIAGIARSGVFFITKPDIISAKIQRTLSAELSDSPVKSLECSCLAYEVLIEISKSTSVRNDGSRYQNYWRLKPVLDFIELNYMKDITLNELAEVIGVTPQHFCVLFKKSTNLKPFDYINYVRVQKSKEYMFLDKNAQIKEIAGKSGFNDTSYFCSLFKKLENMSPGEFKKLYM